MISYNLKIIKNLESGEVIMSFKQILTNNGNKDAVFVNFADDKVKILVPSIGVINLDKDGFIRLINYLRSYKYTLAVQNNKAKYYKEAKNIIGFFIESADNEIITVEFRISGDDNKIIPDVKFKKYDTTTAKVISDISINSYAFARIIDEAKKAGIDTEVEYITRIEFVDKLPAETSAKRNTVYLYQNEYYQLNEDEDELVKIEPSEAGFLTRPNFPSISSESKENVYYNLTNKQDTSPWYFEIGVYTYEAKTNTFTLEDLKVYKTDKLPSVEKAKANTLYVLTRNETDDENKVTKEKGTVWIIKDDKYEQVTKEIITVSKLPIKELAVDKTYYIVNDTMYYFTTDANFTKIGIVVNCVDSLPDVSKIQLEKNVVYTLTKDDGKRVAGSNWIFDFDEDKKEFVEFVDPTEEETEETDSGNGGEG